MVLKRSKAVGQPFQAVRNLEVEGALGTATKAARLESQTLPVVRLESLTYALILFAA